MGLIRKNETFPARPVVIIIVGTPFSYKTSMAITAKNVLLVDSEKGAERAAGRAETYRIEQSWKEIEDDINAGMLNEFDTVALDTGGSIVDDYLWEYGLVTKYTKNSQQNWGTVKDLFKKFVSKLRLQGKDLVIISHEKSKDDGEERIYDLDISGSGKQILLRQADQVGFVTKQDFKVSGKIITKTIITFNPTKSLPFCKNVAQLPDIELPDCNSPEWENFMDREIIAKTKKAITEMSDEQVKALDFIAEWRSSIDALVPGEDATTFPSELAETLKSIAEIKEEHLKKQIRAYFSAHIKNIGWKWDAEKKAFVGSENKPQAEVKPEQPAAEVTEDLFASKV